MQDKERYPYLLKSVLEQNQYENIVDSNILSACLPSDLPVPYLDESRKAESTAGGITRHPGYVRSAQINQVFNYIGFIKRVKDKEYREYLPILFNELNRFQNVFEEIVFTANITISEDIYLEQKKGLQNFFTFYSGRGSRQVRWIEKVWKQQKNYLEKIDTLIDTLMVSGQVFEFKKDPLYEKIVTFCANYFQGDTRGAPGETDIRFVANCYSKIARDGESKTIWSGDAHITRILKILTDKFFAVKQMPQIYQRANYLPRHFKQLFPPVETVTDTVANE